MESGDKTGDKIDEDKRRRAEWILKLIGDRLEDRQIEAIWGLTGTTPPDWNQPPEWVKRAIPLSASIKPYLQLLKKSASSKAELLGAISGFTDASNAAINEPSEDESEMEKTFTGFSSLRAQTQKCVREKSHVIRASNLSDEGATLGETVQHSTGHMAGVKTVQKLANLEVSISAELIEFFWITWPIVETAKSRVELFGWLTDLNIITCTFFNFEKVCKQIDLSPAGHRSEK